MATPTKRQLPAAKNPNGSAALGHCVCVSSNLLSLQVSDVSRRSSSSNPADDAVNRLGAKKAITRHMSLSDKNSFSGCSVGWTTWKNAHARRNREL